MRYSAVLALAGAAAAAPAADAGCPAPVASTTSAAPAASSSAAAADWSVSDFAYTANYIFSTPAHSNNYGTVHFTLNNPAITTGAQAVVCEATSSYGDNFFDGTTTYDCQPVLGGSQVSSKFAFKASADTANTLTLTQTWPEGHKYAGSVTVPLSCADNTWTNPDWQQGEIYSNRTHTCTAPTFPVTPSERS